jgi:hypothetical protein
MGDEAFNSIIDVRQWDKAAWRGVLYAVDLSFKQAPVFGLVFQNLNAAKDIFAGWRSQFGKEDEREQIRISIVEGDIPGKDPGYTVHITGNPVTVADDIQNQSLDAPNSIVGISRVYRMNPQPNSRNLPNFKMAYEKLGSYVLMPVTMQSPNPSSIKLHPEMGIAKKQIVIRNVKDVSQTDIDSVVFAKGK